MTEFDRYARKIKRKLKDYGVSNKVSVRTFDSIVYEIAKVGGYPHIDLPNFDGKRKFVYELLYNVEFIHKPSFQPKIIFLSFVTCLVIKFFEDLIFII